MTILARLAILGVLLVALSAAAWKVYHTIDKGGYDRAARECAAEREAANEKARETRERNRNTGLTAEKIYIDRERVRTEFLVTTQREVINETANLATCQLDPGDIRVLRAAAHSFSADRPAAANLDNPVSATR